MSARVPLTVVEEHHEAFYLWLRAARDGVLPAAATLLHVDEHSDMSLPRLRRPIPDARDDATLAAFTYEELDIGNFIWPAVYAGVINRVLWLRHQHRGAGSWRQMSVCAKDAARLEFVTGNLQGTPYAGAADARRMEYAPVSPGDALRLDQPVVLDVDLDYFCSNDFPDYRGREIEITAAAYEEFQENPYHFLRISPGSRVSAVRAGDRHLLRFNDYPGGPGRTAAPEEIGGRVDAFADWLAQTGLRPSLVVLCRSVASGYMPADQIEAILGGVSRRLGALWPIEESSIHDLLPEPWRERTRRAAER